MTERIRPNLRTSALLLNAAFAAAGLWLELRPRVHGDAWAGAALLAAAGVNAAAIILPTGDSRWARLRRRTRRIAVLGNSGLAAAGLLLLAAIARRGGVGAAEVGAAAGLAVAPLLILAAVLARDRDAAPPACAPDCDPPP